MMRYKTLAAIFLAGGALICAQEPNPNGTAVPQPDPGVPNAVFRVQVVDRSIAAVNYLHMGGATKINFEPTSLMPSGTGRATVESERGVIRVSAEFKNFVQPSTFGPEYLTYVLWAISPDGRPVNMGELTLDHYGEGSSSAIKTTSEIQTFGMIVTAEPYYAVTQPSDVVVMENAVRSDTRGVIETVDAKYELLPRGIYVSESKNGGFVPVHVDKKNPFELYEAENAVMLARIAGADKYAADSYQKALDSLAWAERNQAQKPGQKPAITMAREVVVRAEDARVIAIRAEREEALAQERQAAANREAAANAEADQQAQARARADRERAEADRQRAESDAQRVRAESDRAAAQAASEADRAAAEQAKAEALAASQQANNDRQLAQVAKLEADRARQDALDQQQKLEAEANAAREAAAKAQQDQVELRRQLMVQFNQILQTRETARGLIVNMSDVLFDTAQYSLKPGAREKLAKISGIILAHPGLTITVEGHTDSVGPDDYNMKLSQNRAEAVRAYLVGQGLNSGSVTAQGFGKTRPVADNKTAAGRQQNRRVEMVVAGEILGNPVNPPAGSPTGAVISPDSTVNPSGTVNVR